MPSIDTGRGQLGTMPLGYRAIRVRVNGTVPYWHGTRLDISVPKWHGTLIARYPTVRHPLIQFNFYLRRTLLFVNKKKFGFSQQLKF